MESQPQNPEFRINPENFHPCDAQPHYWFSDAVAPIFFYTLVSEYISNISCSYENRT